MRLTTPMAFSWDCCCSDDEDTSEHSSILRGDGWDRGSGEEKKGCRMGRHTNAGEIAHYTEPQMLKEVKVNARYFLEESDLSNLRRYEAVLRQRSLSSGV